MKRLFAALLASLLLALPAKAEDVTFGSLGGISLAQMANLAANSIICNNTGSPATPIACTQAQVAAMLAGQNFAFSVAQTFPLGTGASPSMNFVGFTGTGFFHGFSDGISISFSGTGGAVGNMYFRSTDFTLASIASVTWNPNSPISAANDLSITRDGAGFLGQHFGVAAQKLAVYNTFTDASNYERGIFDWQGSSNVLSIGTENAGTGSVRNIRFLVGGADKLDYGISYANAFGFAPPVVFGGLSNASFFIDGNHLTGFNTATIGWASTGSVTPSSSADTFWVRGGAAGVIGLNGTTSSFPALKRSAAALAVRLADDSADAAISASTITLSALVQTAVAQSGTVCYNSGTGVVTYDASVGCLASSMRFKHDWRPLYGALAEVMHLQAGRFLYNDPHAAGGGEQIGLNAENMVKVEPDLVGYAPDGQLLGVRYQNTVALLVAAVQEQQREIVALQRRGIELFH